MEPSISRSKAAVRESFDALNHRDRDAFVDCHAPDVVLTVGDETVRGIEAITAAEFAYFDAFPDLGLTIEHLVAEDDLVAGQWQVTGTHEGRYNGIEPTGNAVSFAVMGRFRVDDGRISAVWIVPDQLGLFEQLGVTELPPG